METIRKRVVLDFDLEGYHKWENAIPEVLFLRNEHRHMFQIRVEIEVQDSDREVEIFIETGRLQDYLMESYGAPCQFEGMSCEHIAEDILQWGFEDGYKRVEVYEDGKGGAVVFV